MILAPPELEPSEIYARTLLFPASVRRRESSFILTGTSTCLKKQMHLFRDTWRKAPGTGSRSCGSVRIAS